MTRILTVIILLIVVCAPAALLAGHSSAVNIFTNTCDQYKTNATTNGTNAPGVCTDVEKTQTENPIIHILKAAISIVSYVVGIAAIIGILVSGIRLMTAGGDSNAVASARTGLVYSLVGIAVVALAQAIVVFVLDRVN